MEFIYRPILQVSFCALDANAVHSNAKARKAGFFMEGSRFGYG
jgi:hypothetical protein